MSTAPERGVTTEEELAGLLERAVEDAVEAADTRTSYRTPLVGFASAGDSRFADLKTHIGPHHLLPEDVLEGAKSVISFFLPFSAEVVDAHRVRRGSVAREWAVAYSETNELIGDVCERLSRVLREHGHEATFAPATGNFERATFESTWSHKSCAVIAGLGRFGLHHMVITEAGCAGRFGSVVTTAPLKPAPRMARELCIHLAGGTCKDCVSRCPVGALNGRGELDKELCWQRCTAVSKRFTDLGPKNKICGKCAVGRCALEVPKKGDRSRARKVP